VVRGTASLDTLIFLGHSHQKDKNLNTCHHFLSAKFCRHFVVSPFLFSAFTFEAALFASLLRTPHN